MQKLKNTILASCIVSLVILCNNINAAERLELTLGGGGSSKPSFDQTSFGVNLGLGLNVTRHLELGVRQGLQFVDSGSSALRGSTGLATDWNLHPFKQLTPFVGAVGTVIYGGTSAFSVGPEAGVKLGLTKDSFLFAAGEYRFKVDTLRGPPVKDSVLYRVGIGLKF